jgi:hypothetical protein
MTWRTLKLQLQGHGKRKEMGRKGESIIFSKSLEWPEAMHHKSSRAYAQLSIPPSHTAGRSKYRKAIIVLFFRFIGESAPMLVLSPHTRNLT